MAPSLFASKLSISHENSNGYVSLTQRWGVPESHSIMFGSKPAPVVVHQWTFPWTSAETKSHLTRTNAVTRSTSTAPLVTAIHRRRLFAWGPIGHHDRPHVPRSFKLSSPGIRLPSRFITTSPAVATREAAALSVRSRRSAVRSIKRRAGILSFGRFGRSGGDDTQARCGATISGMSLSQLADVMDELARETWSKIRRAHSVHMSMGEVSITHHVLLALEEKNVALARPVKIHEVSQVLERRVGADFEIWLRLKDGSALGYSIQAKRVVIGAKHLTYPALGHRGERPGEYQYDTLLRHAAKHRSHALHLFYNGWNDSRAGRPYYSSPDPQLYGCAAVPTERVKAAREFTTRKTNNLKAFETASIPWSELLRVHPKAKTSSPTTPTPTTPTPTTPTARPTAAAPPPSASSAQGGANSPDTASPVSLPAGSGAADAAFEVDVKALAEQFRSHSNSHSSMMADRLPEYVQAALAGQQGHLPADPLLPRYVVVVDAG
jgi:hypothetical protein